MGEIKNDEDPALCRLLQVAGFPVTVDVVDEALHVSGDNFFIQGMETSL